MKVGGARGKEEGATVDDRVGKGWGRGHRAAICGQILTITRVAELLMDIALGRATDWC